MEAWQYFLLFLVVAAAYPIGLLIARATKEELKAGRNIFKILIASCVATIIFAFFSPLLQETLLLVATTMLFIIIISAVSLKKAKIKN